MALNIKKVMAEKRISIDAIAALLGLHRNTISSKLSGQTEFTISEGLKLKHNLFQEYDIFYLFSEEKDRAECCNTPLNR